MLRRVLPLVVVALWPTPFLSAQATPEKKPAFEVASIKPNKDTAGGGWSSSGGRQTIIGTTATVLVMSAFNLHEYEIIGAPSWSDTERLDVIAQAEGTPTPEESRLMMQSLLEERFALKAHHETREGPIYRLVLAKKDGTLGPQLLKTSSECDVPPLSSVPWAISACSMRMRPGEVIMGARTFGDLVGTFNEFLYF
jgi:uncharacterized protein (TIGR03435 family)